MAYQNGKDILPAELLQQVQEYIQGELLYIPRNEERAGWGAVNGTRDKLSERNREILGHYLQGASIRELSARYHLSEDSIRKILQRRQNVSENYSNSSWCMENGR